MSEPAYIVTIVNEKTKEVTGFWLEHYESVDEITLGPDQVMFVNELPDGAIEDE